MSTKSRIRYAGLVVLTIVTAALLIGGAGIAFRPSSHSPLLGWVYLIVASSILVATVNRWVKIFPGILGYAALNSSLALYTGQLIGSPPIPISRTAAAAYTILFAASAVISAKFRKRRLNRVDQIALLASVYSIVWASLFATSVAFTALSVGISGLLIALAYDRIQRHTHGHGSSSTSSQEQLS
jgi:hypothetical protein